MAKKRKKARKSQGPLNFIAEHNARAMDIMDSQLDELISAFFHWKDDDEVFLAHAKAIKARLDQQYFIAADINGRPGVIL